MWRGGALNRYRVFRLIVQFTPGRNDSDRFDLYSADNCSSVDPSPDGILCRLDQQGIGITKRSNVCHLSIDADGGFEADDARLVRIKDFLRIYRGSLLDKLLFRSAVESRVGVFAAKTGGGEMSNAGVCPETGRVMTTVTAAAPISILYFQHRLSLPRIPCSDHGFLDWARTMPAISAAVESGVTPE